MSSRDFYSLLQSFLFTLQGRGYLRYIKPDNLMNISDIKVSFDIEFMGLVIVDTRFLEHFISRCFGFYSKSVSSVKRLVYVQ